jgi:hypothetical protein
MAGRRLEDEDVGMENKKVSLAIDRISVEGRPEFNVVLAYDEIAGGMRAKEFFDDLARLHGELFKFTCQLWNFEVMREPQLFEAAVRDASSAEMIVIATRRKEGVSGDARRWMERWLPSKDSGRDAILVLLTGKAAGAHCERAIRASLRQMADRGGVAFLSKEIDWPETEAQLAVPSAGRMLHEEALPPASVVSVYASQRRWALNE